MAPVKFSVRDGPSSVSGLDDLPFPVLGVSHSLPVHLLLGALREVPHFCRVPPCIVKQPHCPPEQATPSPSLAKSPQRSHEQKLIGHLQFWSQLPGFESATHQSGKLLGQVTSLLLQDYVLLTLLA